MNKCVICGVLVKNKLCGKWECKSALSRLTIQNSFKKHGGEITKFRKTNGMHRPEIRALVSTKLRAMGWKPQVQGGNGRGPTPQQLLLASALGWSIEHVVLTGMPRGSPYPSCYKLDVACPELKVGIEIDGLSHHALERKRQDRKKDDFLTGLGWIVLRFRNAEVEKHLNECVQTVLSTISKPRPATPT